MKGKDLLKESKRINSNMQLAREIRMARKFAERIFEEITFPQIIRCKDCKYWQDNNGGYPHEECRWGKGETPDAYDFCSYGERKEQK